MKHITVLILLLCLSTGVSSYPYSEPQVYYSGNSENKWVSTGEFNGDGIKDIFVLNSTPFPFEFSFGVLTGTGSGEFAAYSLLDIDCSSYSCNLSSWLVLDYPPADGLDDIMVVYESDYYTVHLNNGDGLWENVELDRNLPLRGLAGACDCDGDGENDVIAYNFHGFCTIPTAASEVGIAIEEDWSYFLPLADFNGDGYMDVTYSIYMSASTLFTFWGYSNCWYWDPDLFPGGHQMWGAYKGLGRMSVGDLNDDAFDDVVYRCLDDQYYCFIGVYYGSAAGLVLDDFYYWTPDCNAGLFVTDADCDGYDDIGIVDTRLWYTDNKHSIYLYFTEPDTLGARCDTFSIQTERRRGYFYVADLNADSYDDLCYFPADDSIGILINQGPVSTLLASSSIEYISGSKVRVNWDLSCNSCGLSGFQVHRNNNGSDYELIAALDYSEGKTAYRYIDDVSSHVGISLGYRVYAENRDGTRVALIEKHVAIPPPAICLFPNYPNPFNPGTTIAFEVSNQGKVWLDIFDVSGKLVANLINGQEYPSGRHELTWNGTDMKCTPLASGVYYCRLRIDKETQQQKILIVR